MARDFEIPGPAMVFVKGRSDSAIGSLQQLGLSEGPIRVNLSSAYMDLHVNAHSAANIPVDTQWMLATANVSMNLIHFDSAILQACIMESMGGAPTFGKLGQGGQRLGNGLPRFHPAGGVAGYGNHYIGVNITAPVSALPYRFLFSYLTTQPFEFNMGTEKKIVVLNWRAIPYVQDPWNSGLGSYGVTLFDNTLDT